jgi:signal transduction histidine kinase
LEPKIDGGHIVVRAVEREGYLVLEVADTGTGMQDNQQPGLGLTNVKARIEHLFDGQGRLRITENQPSGVCVAIEVPLTSQPVDPKHMGMK